MQDKDELIQAFIAAVPRYLLERAEAEITVSDTPTDDEISATMDMLNAVIHGFYLERVRLNALSLEDITVKHWAGLADINEVIETRMTPYPKCLVLFKGYIARQIGASVLTPLLVSSDDYQIARKLLYVKWYEDAGGKIDSI